MTGFLRNIWITLGLLVAAFVASWIAFMPDADERGVWRAQTGGQILTVTPLTVTLYSETRESCTKRLSFPAHLKMVEWAEGLILDGDGLTLSLNLDGTLDDLRFAPLDALPAACGDATPDAPAPQVFDAFWAAMDEHYAFFDLHGVNWETRRDAGPTPDATDATLFAAMTEALTGLDDGQLRIVTSEGYFSPAEPPAWLAASPDLTHDRFLQAARDEAGAPLTSLPLTGIEYAMLPGDIGYILIRHLDIDTPIGATAGPAMAQAFAEVATALENAAEIVIDLRYNPGGEDTAAFAVASHFAAAPVEVFTKTSRTLSGGEVSFSGVVTPHDATPLDQPTRVLTTRLTGSAAELLTLALREMPQVTVVGERTSGGLSDTLAFTLPNGWYLGLPNQTVRATSGEIYESIGIPPDEEAAVDAAALMQGNDPQLTRVLAQIRGD